MEKTPQSNRLHVTIFGETNVGKSALFNKIIGSDMAIVSEVSGTTTDPITKSMELLPFGPIVLVDTAGLNDTSILGETRMKKTRELLDRTDYALYAVDVNHYDEVRYHKLKREFNKREIPHMVVFTKKDVSDLESLAKLSKKFEHSYVVSVHEGKSIEALKLEIADALNRLKGKEAEGLLSGLLPAGSVVILVVPIDSEAPKGRLILPQVQLIRDCLDHGIRCHVTTEAYLKEALEEVAHVDLVVTDSQIFKLAADMVPKEIPLTSFSILMARQKGNIQCLIQGAQGIPQLQDHDKILIAEACTHNRGHEDIGTIKIPAMLKKVTGKELEFDFVSGREYPPNLSDYALVVQCGGCMMTEKEMGSRLDRAVAQHVAITNYGVVLAYGSGVLERSVEILK